MRRNTFFLGSGALFLLALLVAAVAPAGPDDAAAPAINRAMPFMLQTVAAGLFFLVLLVPLWLRPAPGRDDWRTLPVLLSSFAAAAFLSLALRSLAGDRPVDLYGLLETLLLIAALGLFAAAVIAGPGGATGPPDQPAAAPPPRPNPPPPWEAQQVRRASAERSERIPADDVVVLSGLDDDDPEAAVEEEQAGFEALRRELVILVGGNEAAADRLIRHEEQRTPGLTPQEAAERAIARLEKDRRW